MIKLFLAIFFGGGLGSVLRYAVQLIIHQRINAYNFPWATLTVNIVGSFLIGLFYSLSARFNLSEEVRLFLTAGLCGGFTTFSTFSNDNLALLREGEWLASSIYMIISIVIGIAACLAGALVGSPAKG